MIPVWLKIRTRHANNDIVLKSLNYWLGAFSDNNVYDIHIYSENMELPEDYNIYKIIRKGNLLSNVKCNKLFNHIQSSNITEKWKGAAFALTAPYFYLDKSEIIYNIDADDILIFGSIKKYLKQIEKQFENKNMITLSHDMHYSSHQGIYYGFRPNHWTFGVNLSNTAKMREVIYKTLFKKITPAPWGLNIDYMVDLQLDEEKDTPYVCFITPSLFMHYWILNDKLQEDCKSIKYDLSKNLIEAHLFNNIEHKQKHPKTLLVI